MNDEPATEPNTAAAAPVEKRSDIDFVWVDGAPFTSEGSILVYAPHLLTPDLVRSGNEVTEEAARRGGDG